MAGCSRGECSYPLFDTDLFISGIGEAMKLTGISYNPKTGVMCRHGKPVNGTDDRGYKQISVSNKTMRQHQIAWYLTYGFIPKEIDHINQDKGDNRLINLRACTRSTNMLNINMRSDNTSGVVGVSWKEKDKRWELQHRGQYIGQYKTLAEAKAKKEELVA